MLDRARIFGQEQAFLIGVRVLAGTIGARAAGAAYATLAEVVVAALLDAVRREFERTHGSIRGGEVAVLAMGKLGGREMTAASDLDLIFLYDFDERATASDGERPLAGAAVLHAADPAAARGALGADRRGDALRGRLPPPPVGQFRPARHPYRRLCRLPGQGGVDLGAHGADPRPRRSPATSGSWRRSTW